MHPLLPIHTLDLFLPLGQELQAVLRSLTPAEWNLPTVCGSWTIKDVAAHLLGGSLGRLWSRSAGSPAFESIEFDDLVNLINQGNDLWVQAARRISPEILVEFLELTDHRLDGYFRSLDLDAPAPIAVSWASDEIPPNWFDIAREYTEKWLHQQHIREAAGRPLLTSRQWLFPVLDCFVRALPRTYRNTPANPGTRVFLEITGLAGGSWTLVKAPSTWELFSGEDPQAISGVSMPDELAWRLFTKGLSPEAARPLITITGSQALGGTLLHTVSIMA